MILDHIFAVTLIFATLTTILVTGIVFTFALLVMPGTGKLPDREFLRAFQEMDGIIQRSHPIFITVWLGSNSALLASAILAFGRLDALPLALLLASTAHRICGRGSPGHPHKRLCKKDTKDTQTGN
jgi:uncharacterized membrane protein